jgi:pimeloyl-ACP methyl ester carboxylesterase
MGMADAQINGARIWYDVHGEGEDYLLQIGGAGFAHENFGFVTDKMTPHFKVIEFDLRGYGLSERPEQEYSMELWADDIKGLFDAIGVERAHVHGTSMGGMVALAFAGRYPERVDGLVLDCASAKSDFMARAHWEVWKQLAQAYGMGGEPLALEIATKCLSRRFLDTPAGPETVKVIQGVLERNCVVPVFAGACDAMATMDLRPYAAKITAPTLVMTGSEDCLTPIEAGPDGAGGRWIAENIRDATLHVIEGSGHTNLMEEPELSAAVVIEFFQSVAAKRAASV